MTAILGYAELLSDEAAFATTPVQRLEYCATIKRNGEHLLSIIIMTSGSGWSDLRATTMAK